MVSICAPNMLHVGPIGEVTALTSLVHAERPVLPMGSADHFAVIEDGELGPVGNEDHTAAWARFGEDAQGAGAVGTIEASRAIVGPSAGSASSCTGPTARWPGASSG